MDEPQTSTPEFLGSSQNVMDPCTRAVQTETAEEGRSHEYLDGTAPE
jgi:hypothetical protein